MSVPVCGVCQGASVEVREQHSGIDALLPACGSEDETQVIKMLLSTLSTEALP